MRTQLELVKYSLDRLDLIIKKMKDASDAWKKDLKELESIIADGQASENTDEYMVSLSYRIKNGVDTIGVFISEYVKDAIDLSSVLVNSHSLFKEPNLEEEVKIWENW